MNNIRTIKEQKEYTKLKLYELAVGTFFECNNTFYIKIPHYKIFSTEMPTCFNITLNCISYLSLNTEIYLCSNIEIKYNLKEKI